MEKWKLTVSGDESPAEEAAASLGGRAAIGEFPSKPFDEDALLEMEEACRISREAKAKTCVSLAELRTDLEG